MRPRRVCPRRGTHYLSTSLAPYEGALSVRPAPGTRRQEVKANLFDVLRHHVKEHIVAPGGRTIDAYALVEERGGLYGDIWTGVIQVPHSEPPSILAYSPATQTIPVLDGSIDAPE